MKLTNQRPAKALTSRNELVPGMEVWRTYFHDREPSKLILTSGAILFETLSTRDNIGPSTLDGTWWFECRSDDTDTPAHHESCADRSLDGHNYSGNYLFRSEADAKEWLAETR